MYKIQTIHRREFGYTVVLLKSNLCVWQNIPRSRFIWHLSQAWHNKGWPNQQQWSDLNLVTPKAEDKLEILLIELYAVCWASKPDFGNTTEYDLIYKKECHFSLTWLFNKQATGSAHTWETVDRHAETLKKQKKLSLKDNTKTISCQLLIRHLND